MNAREAIAASIRATNQKFSHAPIWVVSLNVLVDLDAAGFTIVSKEDVGRIERVILDDREGKVSAATVLHMIKDAMQR